MAIFEEDILEKLPTFRKHAREFGMRHPGADGQPAHAVDPGPGGTAHALRPSTKTSCAASLRGCSTRASSTDRMAFARSRAYIWNTPFALNMAGRNSACRYLPGDSDSGMFGGNSNWRGPVWMPVNFLLYIALLRLAAYYGDTFKVECPTGSGNEMSLFDVAHDLAERLIGTFLRDSDGRRPVYGGTEKFQSDPHLARSPAVLRILSRRQRGGHWRQPPDRLDGARSRRSSLPTAR